MKNYKNRFLSSGNESDSDPYWKHNSIGNAAKMSHWHTTRMKKILKYDVKKYFLYEIITKD